MSLFAVPCSIQDAREYVAQFHRHHGPPLSGLFAVACARAVTDAELDDVGPFERIPGDSKRHIIESNLVICGVAIAGRPVARMLQDGWTAEVTRVATDGTKNAPSFLYGACWRAARALGWRKLITYTLASEPGTSLRAAGWSTVGEVTARSWHRETRPRVDRAPLQEKIRWQMYNPAHVNDGSLSGALEANEK